MEDTKSNHRSRSTFNNQNTHSPLLASGLKAEVSLGGIGFREVGNGDFDGDDGQQRARLDRFEVKGVLAADTRSHVKLALAWHVQI
jgi:hypothetical protein